MENRFPEVNTAEALQPIEDSWFLPPCVEDGSEMMFDTPLANSTLKQSPDSPETSRKTIHYSPVEATIDFSPNSTHQALTDYLSTTQQVDYSSVRRQLHFSKEDNEAKALGKLMMAVLKKPSSLEKFGNHLLKLAAEQKRIEMLDEDDEDQIVEKHDDDDVQIIYIQQQMTEYTLGNFLDESVICLN